MGDRGLGTSAIDALPPQGLSHPRRRVTSTQARRRLRVRHLGVGQHTAGFQTIERLRDQPRVGLQAAQPKLQLPTRPSSARQRAEGLVDQRSHRGGVQEALQSLSLKHRADARRPRVGECLNADHALLTVGENHEIPPGIAR